MGKISPSCSLLFLSFIFLLLFLCLSFCFTPTFIPCNSEKKYSLSFLPPLPLFSPFFLFSPLSLLPLPFPPSSLSSLLSLLSPFPLSHAILFFWGHRDLEVNRARDDFISALARLEIIPLVDDLTYFQFQEGNHYFP